VRDGARLAVSRDARRRAIASPQDEGRCGPTPPKPIDDDARHTSVPVRKTP
jgi:hypothetical protein